MDIPVVNWTRLDMSHDHLSCSLWSTLTICVTSSLAWHRQYHMCHIDRHTDRHRYTDRHRQRDRQWHTDKQSSSGDTQCHMNDNYYVIKQKTSTDRQTDRQTDGVTDTDTMTHTERQMDTNRDTHHWTIKDSRAILSRSFTRSKRFALRSFWLERFCLDALDHPCFQTCGYIPHTYLTGVSLHHSEWVCENVSCDALHSLAERCTEH